MPGGGRGGGRCTGLRAGRDLRRALALIELLPAGQARLEQELTAQNRLVALLQVTRGWGAPELDRACARARALCEQLGESDALLGVLTNLWGFYFIHGQETAAAEVGRQLLAIGGQGSDSRWLLAGHMAVGLARLYRGDLREARDHVRWREYAGLEGVSSEDVERSLGLHPLPNALGYAARCEWVLGEAEQAQRFLDEALAAATRIDHPNTLALVRYLAALMHVLNADAAATLESTQRGIAICERHGQTALQSGMQVFRGWARVERDGAEGGVADMAAAFAVTQAAGSLLDAPLYLALMAEGQARLGNLDRALALLDEAFAGRGEVELYDSDLHRRRGELLAALGPEHHAAAVEALRTAIEVAERQGAVPFRARAAAALAKLEPHNGAATAPGQGSLLSARERELLALLGRGLTDKQIAEELVISLATVRSHLDRIRDKTGRRRRVELARLAGDPGDSAT